MTTESHVEEANLAMAEIAADKTASDRQRREKLMAILMPVAQALIDNLLQGGENSTRDSARDSAKDSAAFNPNFVGVTCDSRRPVFLDKEISRSGLVYRKFVFGEELRANA